MFDCALQGHGHCLKSPFFDAEARRRRETQRVLADSCLLFLCEPLLLCASASNLSRFKQFLTVSGILP
jgi:tRNA(Arg) A34 adenosine deaminase TadA